MTHSDGDINSLFYLYLKPRLPIEGALYRNIRKILPPQLMVIDKYTVSVYNQIKLEYCIVVFILPNYIIY